MNCHEKITSMVYKGAKALYWGWLKINEVFCLAVNRQCTGLNQFSDL